MLVLGSNDDRRLSSLAAIKSILEAPRRVSVVEVLVLPKDALREGCLAKVAASLRSTCSSNADELSHMDFTAANGADEVVFVAAAILPDDTSEPTG